MKLEFGRLITAMITPFGDDGAIDIDAFAALADGLIEAGNDTLLVTGTTGESAGACRVRARRPLP